MQFVYPFWLEPRPLSRWTLSEVDSTEYNNKIRAQMQRNATPSFINVEAGNGKRKEATTSGQDEIIRIHTHTGHQQRSNEVQIIIMINAPGAVVWHNTIAETSNEGGSLICEHRVRRHVHCSVLTHGSSAFCNILAEWWNHDSWLNCKPTASKQPMWVVRAALHWAFTPMRSKVFPT